MAEEEEWASGKGWLQGGVAEGEVGFFFSWDR
jgi:hypothetical protein